MKRFLKEMIGIMGLTMFVSSQSPVIAAEASSAKLLAETQISNVQTYAMPTEEQITDLITLTDGWRQDDDGNTTYIKGGELVQNQVLEIDGNYYGFDENGILYVNQSFNMYKSDNGVDYVMACYRAKEDGSLYVNEWYTNQLGNHYYYGQKGEGYSGLHEVDGKTYYFSWGEVCTNQCVSENGKSYYCDPEGYVSDISGDGWHQVGDYYFYIKNGQYLSNTVEKIGNSYYGFDYRGVMYANRDFSIWNFESQMSSYYRAKEDGRLYANDWYTDEREVFYYYGEDGKAYSGLHEIDGIQYCFSEYCRRYQDQSVTIDGKSYYCKSDGSAIELQNNDWTKIDDQNLYVKDGQVLINCVEKIGDSYYGFDEKGFLIVNRSFGIWNEKNERSDEYRAKEDGHLYRNEWYVEEDRTYYYGEDGKAYSGLQEVDGIRYYFYPDGCRYQNQSVTVDGKVYYCKPDGSAIELQNNNWTKVDDHFMYVKDGQVLTDCVEKIGDSYYSFDSTGVMYRNTVLTRWDEATQKYTYYFIKADGRLYVNEWYEYDKYDNYGHGIWYYYGDEGKAASGLTQINGTLYYFSEDGRLYQDQTITVDGKSYYCNLDGIAVELQNNRWTKVDGKYRYVKDGQVLTNCVEKIGDFYYGFDSDGYMFADEQFNLLDSESGNTCYYRAHEDGHLYRNEWYMNYKGLWYYFGDDAKMYFGLREVNGILYYFGSRMYQDESVTVDGKNYYCKSSGEAVELSKNGWNLVDGNYLYVKDGQLLRECLEKIGDAYYYFGYSGVMLSDTTFVLPNTEGEYRVHADGSLYISQWYQINGYWEYYDETGLRKTGWLSLGNTWYYLNEYGWMVTGWQIVDGTWYFFDGSGAMVVGWCLVGNNWYYLSGSGAMVTGWLDLNGTWYYMGADGAMLTGTQVIGGTTYIFNQDGAWVAN